MPATNQLSQWATEWASHRSISEDECLFEVPAPQDQPAESPGSQYTVSSGMDIAGLLLDQLRSMVRPDMATDALRSSRYTVSSAPAALPPDLLSPGRLLQLKPGTLPGASRPVYVLIEKVNPGTGEVLAVPFSPVSLPAIPAELTTGMEDSSLAVLCLWNARWIPLATAARCWEIGQAPVTLMAEIADLRRRLAAREPLPPAFAARTGPPLTLPNDPREEYLAAEEALWPPD